MKFDDLQTRTNKAAVNKSRTVGSSRNGDTAWSSKDGSEITMVLGDRPKFADGFLHPDCGVLLWRIEAATWEEAKAVHNLRMTGWEP